MRSTAVVVLTIFLFPGAVLGQGSQASGRRMAFPVSLALPRMADPSIVQVGEVTFTFEQPEHGDSGPLRQRAGAARVGTVAGWLVGLAMGPAIFHGRDSIRTPMEAQTSCQLAR